MKCLLLPLFLIFLSTGFGQNWKWAYSIRSTQEVWINNLETDSLGFAYLSGNNRTGTVTLSSSAGSYSSAVLRSFLAKYNTTGSLAAISGEWKSNPPGGYGIGDYSTDKSGNTFVIGGYRDTICLGTGADTITRIAPSGKVMSYVAKLDHNGKALWLHAETDSCGIGPSFIQSCENNKVIEIGSSGLVCDPENPPKGYIRNRSSATGNVIWQEPGSFIHTYNSQTYVNKTLDNGFLVHGHYLSGPVSFEALTNTLTAPSPTPVSKTDTYLIKYDLQGAAVWLKNIRGADYQWGGEVTVDQANNIVFSIYSDGLCYYDNVPLMQLASRTFHLIKVDQDGNYITHKSFVGAGWGGTGPGWGNFAIYDIKTDRHNNVFVTANMDTTFSIGSDTVYKYAGPNNLAMAIIKFDPLLNYKWSEYIQGCCRIHSKISLHDSLLYLAVDHSGTVTLNNSAYTFTAASGLFKTNSFIAAMKNDLSLPTDIEENQVLNVNLYPNPASEWIYIYSAAAALEHVELIDMAGKSIIANTEKMQNGLRVGVADVEPGIYLLKIRSGLKSEVKKVAIN